MGRRRIIDTDEFFFDTEVWGLIGERGALCFQRLWGIAEDWGGYKPHYQDLSLKMGLLRASAEEVEYYVRLLIRAMKIYPYFVNGNTEYHWIKALLKFNPLRNPAMPKIPLPPWVSVEKKQYPQSKRIYGNYRVLDDKIPTEIPEKYKNPPVKPTDMLHVADVNATGMLQIHQGEIEGKSFTLSINSPFHLKSVESMLLVAYPYAPGISETKRREEKRRYYLLECILTDTLSSEQTLTEPDKEAEKPQEKPEKRGLTPAPVLKLWNTIMPIPGMKLVNMTDDRRRKISNRLTKYPEIETWEKVFTEIKNNPFLRGEKKSFRATLDWLIKNDTNIAKVLEGAYDDHKGKLPQEKKPGKYDDISEVIET